MVSLAEWGAAEEAAKEPDVCVRGTGVVRATAALTVRRRGSRWLLAAVTEPRTFPWARMLSRASVVAISPWLLTPDGFLFGPEAILEHILHQIKYKIKRPSCKKQRGEAPGMRHRKSGSGCSAGQGAGHPGEGGGPGSRPAALQSMADAGIGPGEA